MVFQCPCQYALELVVQATSSTISPPCAWTKAIANISDLVAEGGEDQLELQSRIELVTGAVILSARSLRQCTSVVSQMIIHVHTCSYMFIHVHTCKGFTSECHKFLIDQLISIITHHRAPRRPMTYSIFPMIIFLSSSYKHSALATSKVDTT